ncbi:MAG: sortase [Actinobacteria bacterium]|uniref:Unannotated protein n=1 Tax=freshwater metagenome TaxID=449393 RepID=A0A6J7U1S1_9ZZZZ|nr:sortase [Actinomycetota bacterium]MSZ05157.1 sortase [Actinomycetota bacterium]MTB06323.1 sortase [Actinomycetota bacterium]
MVQILSRRQVLKSAMAVAAAGGLAVAVGGQDAEAVAPAPFGTIHVRRLWGTRRVRQRIVGTRRYRTVTLPRTKGLYAGTEKKVLDRGGLCHWTGSAEPFAVGNCVLFGHRTSAGGPLRYSHRIKVGDPIVLTVGGTALTYFVSEKPKVISAVDVAAVMLWGDSSRPGLTLVSCSKRNKLPTSTKYRLLIRAQASTV